MQFCGAPNAIRIGREDTLVLGFDLAEPRATGQDTVVGDDGLIGVTELVTAHQCRSPIQNADPRTLGNVKWAVGLQLIKSRKHRLTRLEAAASFRQVLDRW